MQLSAPKVVKVCCVMCWVVKYDINSDIHSLWCVVIVNSDINRDNIYNITLICTHTITMKTWFLLLKGLFSV